MPIVKKLDNARTIVQYTNAEFTKLLGVDRVLAVYPLNGNIEVVTSSDTTNPAT
jgi:hypothetical protein